MFLFCSSIKEIFCGSLTTTSAFWDGLRGANYWFPDLRSDVSVHYAKMQLHGITTVKQL